jgi:hypothetical protein
VCSATTDQSVGDVQVQILPDDVVPGHAGGTSDAVLVEESFFLKGWQRMLQEVGRNVAC